MARIGLIGRGNAGMKRLTETLRSRGLCVPAVCDVNEPSVRTARKTRSGQPNRRRGV